MRCTRHQSQARATWLRLERGGTGEEEPLTRLGLLLSSLERSAEIATEVGEHDCRTAAEISLDPRWPFYGSPDTRAAILFRQKPSP